VAHLAFSGDGLLLQQLTRIGHTTVGYYKSEAATEYLAEYLTEYLGLAVIGYQYIGNITYRHCSHHQSVNYTVVSAAD